MTLASCLYEGWVRHRRYGPREHAFRMPLYMMYLDLSEVDEVFRGRLLWSAKRPAAARFKRSDYLGDAGTDLDEAVRARVAAETGERPAGPIRVLTHLRWFGYVFNPVTFYYCFDRAGERVETIVAEITNTPWKERHAYVLARRGGALRWGFDKAFHVSPFMAMEQRYAWRFSEPGERLGVHMRSEEAGGKVFDATLGLRRTPITGVNLARVLAVYPAMTARVIGRIHFEALRLWLKRVPVHAHPKRARAAEEGMAR